MARPVNPKRRYSSARRTEQAAETRAAVLAAAREAFVTNGWQKTTIASIARDACVSSETIYATFGSKRAVLEALVASAVRGDRPETPLLQQAGPRAVAEAADQRQQIALFASDISATLSRVGPLMAVVRSAAEADGEMAALYANLHRGRRRNLEFVIDALLSRGPLKEGTERDAAVSTLWRLASPELFVLVTGVEGGSPESYGDWLARSLIDLLLPRPE